MPFLSQNLVTYIRNTEAEFNLEKANLNILKEE